MWINNIYWLGHDIGRLHLNLVNGEKTSALSHIMAICIDIEGIEDGLDMDATELKASVEKYGRYLESLDDVKTPGVLDKYFDMVCNPVESFIYPLFKREN